MCGGGESGKEIVLITLERPLIYLQPIAVDKAILVWLNYKNAYDYWNDQRSALNTEVLAAMPPQLVCPATAHVSNRIHRFWLTIDVMISIPCFSCQTDHR